MSKEKQLFKNTAIVSLGKICTQLITFFLLPLYTYILTAEEYGIVDLLNNLVSLLIPIVILQIDQGVFRYLLDCRGNEKEEKKIISSTFFFVLTQSIIYLIVFAFISTFIHNDYKYFLAINLIATVFSSIFLQISRGMGDNTRYAIGSFITGLSTVCLNVILIAFIRLGAYGLLIATFFGNILCILYLFISKKLYKYISVKAIDYSKLKSILKYSVLLVPNMLSWWVVNASDRLIISNILGLATNGIYSTANHFSGAIVAINNIFSMTWTESASINIDAEDRNEYFSKIFDIVIRFFGALCLGVIAYMPFAFSLFINEKFGEAYWQIPILLLATLFNVFVSFLGSIYIAKKLTNEIAKTSIISAIINIIINVCLIKYIGLYAASISTLISYFLMFVYRLIDSKKYVKLSVEKNLIFSFIIMYALSFVGYYMRNTIICLLIAIIITIYAIYINRKNMSFFVKIIKDKINGFTNHN